MVVAEPLACFMPVIWRLRTRDLKQQFLLAPYFGSPEVRRYFSIAGVLSPPSIERAVAKRQSDFLAGRLLAQQALDLLGYSSGPIAIRADRSPDWPPGTKGSLSHTAKWAVCLVSPSEDTTLGVDIEQIQNHTSGWAVYDLCLTPKEKKIAQQGLSIPPSLSGYLGGIS